LYFAGSKKIKIIVSVCEFFKKKVQNFTFSSKFDILK